MGSSSNKETLELNQQRQERLNKLQELRDSGWNYPNKFQPDSSIEEITAKFHAKSKTELESINKRVSIAGRIMLKRVMGRALFMQIQETMSKIQIYVKQDEVGADIYALIKDFDLGDIVGATGVLFKTHTEELSVRVSTMELLTKALRPLPDKWHGLVDTETRYRHRYVDLIVNEKTRDIIYARSKIIYKIRDFFVKQGFLEVETPMMHPIPGGAIARPFITHHNALKKDLYLRIAPELYLKRLVVGGLLKVFELNRNFRNEGVSTRHNPEFTMIEFYQAYATYKDLMLLTEKFFHELLQNTHGTLQINYQNDVIDFSKFTILSIQEALIKYCPELNSGNINDASLLTKLLGANKVKVEKQWGIGRLKFELFSVVVEEKLIQPTFITEFPAEVSPLSRSNDNDPSIVDRFELYIAGKEIANGFSELNDPEDQARRFQQQVLDRQDGDEEAMYFDADYIEALEYGLPPTAGEGIGIDRLVMLLTDAASIREVLLFPQLRDLDK